MTPTWLILIGSAYLAGSIPFGVMIARARGVNIRDHGSGNIGATNVSRTLGRQFGLLCLFLDFFHGFIGSFIVHYSILLLNHSIGAGQEAY